MIENLHLQGALTWHDAGFSVFPILADGTKKPFGKWGQYIKERPDRATVERWWKTAPAQGVGLAMGPVSGNAEMLELEGEAFTPENLVLIYEECHRLSPEAGDTWWDLTENGYLETSPNGGLHLIYRVDGEVPGNHKVANRPPTADELKSEPHLRSITLAETRGTGGFVVVAPTGGRVHKTGKPWAAAPGTELGVVLTIDAGVRDLICEAIHNVLDTMPTVAPPVMKPTNIAVDSGDGPGADFNRKTSWDDLLHQYGWQFHHPEGGELFYTRPGKKRAHGHSASLYYQGSDNLFCWSSAAGVPTETPLSKWALYTYMEHGGDFSASARELRRQGFGGESAPSRSDWLSEIPMADRVKAQSITMPELTDAEMSAPAQPGFVIDEYTETGVAHAMVNLFGDQFRMVFEEKNWRVYDNGVWSRSKCSEVDTAVEDATLRLRVHTKKLVDRAATALANARLSEDKDLIAEAKEELKEAEKLAGFATACRQSRGHNAVRTRFSQQSKVSTSVDHFDRDRGMLCVGNGVLNLDELAVAPASDLELYGHSPNHMLTRRIGVDFVPQARADRWVRYLEEVIPDPEYRAYLQRAAGMALLGDTSEAAFFVLWGGTGCGKSVFFEVLRTAFGDFGKTAAPATFREDKEGSSRRANDLHQLRGSRLVAMSETSQQTVLNEELIKRVTGGDEITSHALYEENVTWKPEFTMFMGTNFKPIINCEDRAIWRRVKLVHFPRTFFNEDGTAKAEMDRNLPQWLIDNELPGILNWILEGARQFKTMGLSEPDSMREAVKEYREESDPVLQFVTEAAEEGIIECAPEFEMTMTSAYATYATWAKNNNMRPIGKNKFGTRLEELGYKAVRGSSGIRMRSGMRLNPHQWIGEVTGTDTWRAADARR